MTSENYLKMTERELRKLIKDGDNNALDEFDRRIEKGEIKRRSYSIEQIEEMIANPMLSKRLGFL